MANTYVRGVGPEPSGMERRDAEHSNVQTALDGLWTRLEERMERQAEQVRTLTKLRKLHQELVVVQKISPTARIEPHVAAEATRPKKGAKKERKPFAEKVLSCFGVHPKNRDPRPVAAAPGEPMIVASKKFEQLLQQLDNYIRNVASEDSLVTLDSDSTSDGGSSTGSLAEGDLLVALHDHLEELNDQLKDAKQEAATTLQALANVRTDHASVTTEKDAALEKLAKLADLVGLVEENTRHQEQVASVTALLSGREALIKQLEVEVDEARSGKSDLKTQLVEAIRQHEAQDAALQAQVESLKTQLLTLGSEAEALRERADLVPGLQEEDARMKALCESEQKSREADKKCWEGERKKLEQTLNGEITRLKAELANRDAAWAGARTEVEGRARDQKFLWERWAENSDLAKEFKKKLVMAESDKESADLLIASLMTQVSSLEAEAAELCKKECARETEMAKLKSVIASWESRATLQQDLIDQLYGNIDVLEKRKRGLKKQLAVSEGKVSHMQSEAVAMQAQTTELQAQKEALEALKAQLKTSVTELQAQVKDSQEKRELLGAELSRSEADRQALALQVQEHEVTIAVLNEQQLALEAQYQALEAAKDKEIADQEAELENVRQEVETLTRQVSDRESEISSLKCEITGLTDKVRLLAANVSWLGERLQTKAEEYRSLQMDKDHDIAMHKLELDSATQTVDTLRRQVSDKDREISQLKSEKENLTEQNVQLTAALAAAAEQATQLSADLAAATEQATADAEQLDALAGEIQTLRTELHQTLRARDELVKQVAAGQQEVLDLKRHNQDLLSNAMAMKQEHQACLAAMEHEHQAILAEANAQLSQLDILCTGKDQMVMDLQETIDELRDQLDRTQTQFKALQDVISKQVDEDYKGQPVGKQWLLGEKKVLHAEVDDLTKRLQEAQSQVKSFRTTNTDLKRKLAQAQSSAQAPAGH